jgi:hypothetical protein
MSNQFMMFVPLEKQPESRFDCGWWVYDGEIFTTSQMVDYIEKTLDLPSHVVNLKNGVWGLMVEAVKVQL